MNRLFTLTRGGLTEAPDRQLLERFLADRDEAAFAELVRRYGPVVWGVCRRALPDSADAEDAFQATFLVFVRRAGRLATHPAVGPWLYRVAAMTARNLRRGNRRRAVVRGKLDHDVPVSDPAAGRVDARLDLDAALTRLPEKYRVPVVLCHLQGLSRREAAARLGCPEGTLSSLLAAALRKLRVRLGGRDPAAVLAAAGGVLIPAGLVAGTARVATVYATSTLTAAGVSPAVAGLTNGVLRMFWVKKLVTAAVLAVLTGGLLAGLAGRPDGTARAADPPGDGRANPSDDPAAAARRLEQRLGELEKQKAELDRAVAAALAEKAKLDRATREKAAAAELGSTLAVVVTEGGKGWGWGKPPFTVREVVGGKIGEVYCYEPEVLERYLTRTFNDPKGPKTLRLYADQDFSHAQIHRVCAACAAAGYKKALFILPEAPLIVSVSDRNTRTGVTVKRGENPKEIDLTGYGPPAPVQSP